MLDLTWKQHLNSNGGNTWIGLIRRMDMAGNNL